MPFAVNQGIRIHYEIDGEGPPLVMVHSLTRSLKAWYDFGYAQELGKDYQLILVDARGHGESDKPHDPAAYSADLRAGDVVAVLDDLGVDRAHYLGYSMGARIGFAMIVHALDRISSLVLGGMSPFRTEAGQKFEEGLLRTFQMSTEAYVAAIEQRAGPLPAELRARFLANDARALLGAVEQAISPTGKPVDWDEVLPTVANPCLLYIGEADPFLTGAEQCADLMPRASIVTFPGLDHGGTLVRSDLVLPHIQSFLDEN
jgi:pimeloyl-ACP methyl ester carboxylesterase